MTDQPRTLKFTWGGSGIYTVNLRIRGVSLTPIYEAVASVETGEAAREIAERGNAVLKRWVPELLDPAP